MYSALCGLGVGYALTRPDRSISRRLAVAVSSCAPAWGLHFLWKAGAPGSDAAAAAQVVLKVVVVAVAIVLAYRRAMWPEWQWFTSVADGERAEILTAEEAVSLRIRELRRKACKGLHGEEVDASPPARTTTPDSDGGVRRGCGREVPRPDHALESPRTGRGTERCGHTVNGSSTDHSRPPEHVGARRSRSAPPANDSDVLTLPPPGRSRLDRWAQRVACGRSSTQRGRGARSGNQIEPATRLGLRRAARRGGRRLQPAPAMLALAALSPERRPPDRPTC
ncbi:PrsW family glutamic-type intramembrane protease [Lentzea sp. E54]|uniref:PrsW family glutamic-type intramembrane protease n=1 Tax=Lentzea xerophila TaxID=3435883 RepID=UPI003DA69921